MALLGVLIRRMAQGLVIVLLTALIIFTLLRVVPGDPVRLIVGGMAPDNVVEEVARKMGLRDPCSSSSGVTSAGCCMATSATPTSGRKAARSRRAAPITIRRAARWPPCPTSSLNARR
jgi:hypothetical protein